VTRERVQIESKTPGHSAAPMPLPAADYLEEADTARKVRLAASPGRNGGGLITWRAAHAVGVAQTAERRLLR